MRLEECDDGVNKKGRLILFTDKGLSKSIFAGVRCGILGA